jgi:hypothetical protein
MTLGAMSAGGYAATLVILFGTACLAVTALLLAQYRTYIFMS